MIFACKNISKSYGTNTILEKISFNIDDKEKVAIIGINGAGKTTIFKIISGEINCDCGDIFLKKDISIGYLSQNVESNKNISIYDEVLTVFNDVIEIENKLRNMENEMANIDKNELPKFMEKYSNLSNKFEQIEGYSYKSRIRGVLNGLGFSENEYNKKINTLSGGQKTRVHLCKLLLTQPDILLLDEPTNHLDINSILWLEDFLRTYTKSVVIISHDRYFIDKIVSKVIEIENKKSYIYNGNYTNYSKQKQINQEVELKQYLNQQKVISHQQDIIKKLRSFNREKSIKRAESREKSLEKINKIEKPKNMPNKMRLNLTLQTKSGNDVLQVENLSKSFGNKQILKNITFKIRKGEKVAIIGHNGTGKTTLFKILLGEINFENGSIKFGANVNIGYYDQEHKNLDESKTIFEELSETYPSIPSKQIRDTLASFIFTGDDIFKKIGSLSGGEKGRIVLSKIMLSKANLLILDEPTNHLDMFSKEALEKAINNYEGSVLYISHDRYFINKTAKRILHITSDGLTEYMGNYDYYIQKIEEQKTLEKLNTYLDINQNEIPSIEQSITKIDWKKQKEEQAKERKKHNKIKKIELEIDNIEIKIKELENLLFDEKIGYDLEKSKNIFDEKSKLEFKLEKLLDDWEKIQ